MERTPLDNAVKSQNMELIKYLLLAGAMPFSSKKNDTNLQLVELFQIF